MNFPRGAGSSTDTSVIYFFHEESASCPRGTAARYFPRRISEDLESRWFANIYSRPLPQTRGNRGGGCVSLRRAAAAAGCWNRTAVRRKCEASIRARYFVRCRCAFSGIIVENYFDAAVRAGRLAHATTRSTINPRRFFIPPPPTPSPPFSPLSLLFSVVLTGDHRYHPLSGRAIAARIRRQSTDYV